MAAMKAKF